jgi:hypothetical protein
MAIEIELPYNYTLRDYQTDLYAAMDSGYDRAAICWHRRGGKDLNCLNYMIKEMARVPENYWYVLPEYGQARKAIWENKTKDGRPYLDFFPPDLIKRKREQDMMITFKNGSCFRLVGGDNVDSLVGAGPRGIVMSEYSLQRPSTWQYLEPMIIEKEGWAIFNGTPRGENHFHTLMEMAKNNPRWFSQVCTIDDTGMVPLQVIEQMRLEGKPEENIQQEYYCSFAGSIFGSYYGAILERLKKSGKICRVEYDDRYLVNTAWDIGMHDATTIWFYQVVGNTFRVIDCYSVNHLGLPGCLKEVNSKPYAYGKHWAPFDIKVAEWGTGNTRIEQAVKLGIRFHPVTKVPLMDGINATRSFLMRCVFDEVNCKEGLQSLKQYRKDFDEKRNCFKDTPLHDWSSHFADAFRYLALSAEESTPNNRPHQQRAISDYL